MTMKSCRPTNANVLGTEVSNRSIHHPPLRMWDESMQVRVLVALAIMLLSASPAPGGYAVHGQQGLRACVSVFVIVGLIAAVA